MIFLSIYYDEIPITCLLLTHKAYNNMSKDTTELANLNAPDEKSAMQAIATHTPITSPDSSSKFGVEGCCVEEYWAVIERDGTLVRGRNVWRTKRLATGQYEVIFTGDVSNGAYVATVGRPGIATEPSGQIGVALRYSITPPEVG